MKLYIPGRLLQDLAREWVDSEIEGRAEFVVEADAD